MTIPQTEAEVLALSQEAPLTELEIGGKRYAIGTIPPHKVAELSAWGARIAAGSKAPEDVSDPQRVTRALLEAGGSNFFWPNIAPLIKPDIALKAGREFMRQILVKALASGHKGSA